MANSASIASVTVAYNGAHTLPRHLTAVKQQTRKVDEIIVVNNASTDDTLKSVAAVDPKITIVNLPKNSGVGGGFAAGLEYAALQKKYDWIWLFDQDSCPAPDALEQLLNAAAKHGTRNPGIAIVAPVCRHPQTGLSCPGMSWRNGRLVQTPIDPGNDVTFVDTVISSGTLIRRDAVERAGLPRADFFMDFVDHEHCLRIRRHGFQIAVVRDSVLQHSLGEPRRVRFLGRSTSWTDHAPWREYYMIRNEVFTLWNHYPGLRVKIFTLQRLAWHMLGIALFGREKLACFRMIARGFRDGRAGRLGIRYLPTSSAGQRSEPEMRAEFARRPV